MICSVLITTTQVMNSLVCFIDKRKLFPKELFCYTGLFAFAAASLIPKYGRHLLLLFTFSKDGPLACSVSKIGEFEKLISSWGCYPCRVHIRFSLFFSLFLWGWPYSWAREGRGARYKVGSKDDDASMQWLQTLPIKYITCSYPLCLTKTKIAQWCNSKKPDKSKCKTGSKNCKPRLE